MEKGNFYAKMTKLALEIGLIFGLPAILVGVFGSHLSRGKLALFLGLAFLLSWTVFFIRYRKIIKGK